MKNLPRVVELSDVINSVENEYKTRSKKLLSLFDVKQGARVDVKHYPLDDACCDADEVPERLIRLSSEFWLTIYTHLSKAVNDATIVKGKKIGEILICQPSLFNKINTPLDELKIDCQSYYDSDNELTKIRAQVNFTVNLY